MAEQHCVPEACNEAIWDNPGLEGTLRSCPGTSRCQPDFVPFGVPPTGLGRCIPAGALLTPCEGPDDEAPFRSDTCGDGSFCLAPDPGELPVRYYEAFFASTAIPANPPVCFWPVTEGQRCDSSLANRDRIVGGARVRMGFDPCEEGTFCVDDPTTPGLARRCLRPCTNADGAADATLCNCDDAVCRTLGSPVIDPESGTALGANFCRPCLRSNRGGCGEDPDVACCDDGASCHPDVFFPEPGNTVCCRARGDSCDVDAALPQCCEDAVCTPDAGGAATCQPCATEGMPPGNFGCCPNHVLVGAGTPSAVCRYCTRAETIVDTRGGVTSPAYCGAERFEIRTSDDTRADGIFVASSSVEYPYFFGGTLAGPLVNTLGDAGRAWIDVGPEYRGYLFDQDVRAGTSVGGAYIELPQDDLPDGGIVAVNTNLTSATSFLLTDLGACSARTSWDTFASVISAGVNRALAARLHPVDGGDRLLRSASTTSGMTLSPIIRAAPTSVYGLARDESVVHVDTQYDLDLLPDGFCDGVRAVRLQANLVPRLVPGFVVTAEARADDAAAAAVGCARPAPGDTVYTCTLPRLAGGVLSTEVRMFPRGGDYYEWQRDSPTPPAQDLAMLDMWFAGVSCAPVRDRIQCSVPRVTDDAVCHPDGDNCPCSDCELGCAVSPFGETIDCRSSTAEDDPYEPDLELGPASFPRRVEYIPGARDIDLTVENVEVDINDICDLEELITGMLERVVAREVRGQISVEVARALQLILGSRATTDFGVPVESLPTCTFDSDCTVGLTSGELLFGGSRHGCIDHDGSAATPNVCDLVRFEPRRLIVGPRGLDIVLADGPDDPQYAAFSTRPPSMLGNDDVVSCLPDRLRSGRSDPLSAGGSVLSATLPAGGSGGGPLAERDRDFCDTAEAGDCICSQTGTICGLPTAIVVAGFEVPGMAFPPDGMVCTNPTGVSACCLPGTTTCAVRSEP